MAIRIYKSENVTIWQDTEKNTKKTHTSLDYRFDDNTNFYTFYDKYDAVIENNLSLGDFQKQDGSPYASDEEFQSDMDSVINAQGVGAGRIVVTQNNFPYTLGGDIDSSKEYFLDGVIDVGDITINIPSGGLLLTGYGFDLSKLVSSEDNYTLFSSANSGNIFLRSFSIQITGTNSQVFDLTGNTGFEAIEMIEINFDSCTSLGELTSFRQGLENNTGRFGGTPELTFSGAWLGGYRLDVSIALNMNDFTALFKTGTGLTFAGRFIIGINCNLPTNGTLIDFSASNFTNDESFKIENSFIRRDAVIDSSDTTIYPNIDEKDIRSFWNDNVGVPNTQKYIRQAITTAVTTTINTAGVYEVLEGAWAVDADISHFDSPVNGQLRLLSGNGKYQIFGNLTVEGRANDVVDIRVTRSTDNGVSFPEVVNHVSRQINSLVGGRDVAFFDINFLSSLKAEDRVRLEIENVNATNNLTAELDSTFIITEV
ncbi:MAG: hypothetical protein HRU26_17540 [Psychroserpens sp.]|nr:hypothetical protein [Psychroserpens sp.]